MSEFFSPKLLKEGGAWAIVAFALFTLYKILTNDLTHINASTEKQTIVLEKLSGAVDNNTHAIERLQAALISGQSSNAKATR